MKVEKREIEQPKPPCEIVVTMNGEEAQLLINAVEWYLSANEVFRANASRAGSHASQITRLADKLGEIL